MISENQEVELFLQGTPLNISFEQKFEKDYLEFVSIGLIEQFLRFSRAIMLKK